MTDFSPKNNSMSTQIMNVYRNFSAKKYSAKGILRAAHAPLAASTRSSVLLGAGFLSALLSTGLVAAMAGSVPTSRTEFDLLKH
jgi:hypothetical protein